MSIHPDIKHLNKLFPTIHYQDLVKFREKPGHFIMGKGFLKRGAGSILVGGTGIGKSIVACQIAVACATGMPVFGIEVKKAVKVLLIQAENDEGIMKRDFLSIVECSKAKKALVQKNLYIKAVPGMVPEYFAPWLEDQLKKIKPDLLIIDPYQSFVGGVDLNKTETWFAWIEPIELMIKSRKIAFLLVAHTTKPRERKGWTIYEMVYAMLGTSAAPNWARSVSLLLAREDGRFELLIGKGAEFTGLVKDGYVVRRIFLEHSRNPQKPYWKMHENQLPPIKADMKKAVREAAKKYPELSQTRLAKEILKISPSTVNEYYPDDMRKGKRKKKK